MLAEIEGEKLEGTLVRCANPLTDSTDTSARPTCRVFIDSTGKVVSLDGTLVIPVDELLPATLDLSETELRALLPALVALADLSSGPSYQFRVPSVTLLLEDLKVNLRF